MLKKITIGFLTDITESQYQQSIISGIYDFIKQKEYNFFCIEGGSSPFSYKKEFISDILRRLVKNKLIDGLILLTASILPFIKRSEVSEILKELTPLPIISIGEKLKNIPSILINKKHYKL